MTSLWLFVEPQDVLFFRDSKPFGAGEFHTAASIDVLNPATFYGMLRGRLHSNGIQPDDDSMKDLRIEFLSWAKRHNAQDGSPYYTPYFPSPSNLVFVQDVIREEKGSGKRLHFASYEGIPQKLPIRTDSEETASWGWVKPDCSHTGLKAEDLSCFFGTDLLAHWVEGNRAAWKGYLTGILPTIHRAGFHREKLIDKACFARDLYEFENRTGLGRHADNPERKTAREGLLYTISMIRPKDGVGFIMKVSSEKLNLGAMLSGFGKLGGWQKGVRIHAIEKPSKLTTIPEPIKEECRYIFVYFYTLSAFANGHLPDWIDGQTRKVNFAFLGLGGNAPSCVLSACYSYKPFPISGWDMVRSMPKPMTRMVPPGAVWFIGKEDGKQFSPDETECITTAFGTKTSLSDAPSPGGVTASVPYRHQGFGLFFTGIVK